MLAGTDDHLTWLSPVILNLENMGLTHLESIKLRLYHSRGMCVEASNVINDPKCNKGPKCNNF